MPLGSVFLLLSWGLLLLTGFALVDAVVRPQAAFVAAGKQTKTMWLIFLGMAAAWQLLGNSAIGLIGLVGVVATIVYLVDVRPALRQVGGGRPRGGGPDRPW